MIEYEIPTRMINQTFQIIEAIPKTTFSTKNRKKSNKRYYKIKMFYGNFLTLEVRYKSCMNYDVSL